MLNPVVVEKVDQETHNIDQIDYEGLLELFSRDGDPPIPPLNTNYLDQVYSPFVIDSRYRLNPVVNLVSAKTLATLLQRSLATVCQEYFERPCRHRSMSPQSRNLAIIWISDLLLLYPLSTIMNQSLLIRTSLSPTTLCQHVRMTTQRPNLLTILAIYQNRSPIRQQSLGIPCQHRQMCPLRHRRRCWIISRRPLRMASHTIGMG